MRSIDETDQFYGSLKVLKRSQQQTHSNTYWHVLCSCGKAFDVSGAQLRGSKRRKGQTKCEDCRNVENSKTPANSETPFNDLFARYKKSAQDRSLAFSLTREQFRELTQAPCRYCASPPSNRRTKHRQTLLYSGIDRVNNEVGYVAGNCVSCCEPCNIAKHTHSVDEFFSWVARVYERNGLRTWRKFIPDSLSATTKTMSV
jgi:hypothetical protein